MITKEIEKLMLAREIRRVEKIVEWHKKADKLGNLEKILVELRTRLEEVEKLILTEKK